MGGGDIKITLSSYINTSMSAADTTELEGLVFIKAVHTRGSTGTENPETFPLTETE